MSGSKITNAKNGILAFLSGMDPAIDNVGLVVLPPATSTSQACSTNDDQQYQDTTPAYLLVPLSNTYASSLGNLNDTSPLVSTVNCVHAVGGTSYTLALDNAYQELQANGRQGTQKVIVFLSDGAANFGPQYYPNTSPYLTNPCKSSVDNAATMKANKVLIYTIAYTTSTTDYCMRDHPADLGLAPYGGEEIEAPRAPTAGPVRTALGGLREGARSGTFWLLTGSFFVCGASTNGLVGTHLIPAAHDHGISEVTAASYLAAIGVFDIIGTTFSGWLTDRYDPRLLLFWYYGLRGLSLLALHSVLGSPSLGLLAFIVFYGLDWVATVPPTVALTADAFGRERVGIMPRGAARIAA